MDLGLERAGMQCVGQVEIDDYCQRVLTKHWPNVPKYRDVRSVGAYNLQVPIPFPGLVCGGFPCQDISNAGRRVGITGERSGLWREYARIIRELRPRYVLVENVAALLQPIRRNGRIIELAPIGRVLGDLAACGYDAEWEVIPACALGAPHTRERVFIVAYTDSIGGQRRGVFPRWAGRDVTSDQVARQIQSHVWLPVADSIRRAPHGLPRRLDKAQRLKGIGNAVVPHVAEFIGQLIIDHARLA